MKKQWVELEESLTIKDMVDEIDLMYGDKVQFKTTCHRVINATYDFMATFVSGGCAGSDDYFRVNNHDEEFLQDKKIIKYYRELKDV